jgi:PhnB protein
MEAIVPYLMFNGNAGEALAFYAKAFNGKVVFSQTYGESPEKGPADYKDKIMHATFQAGSLTLMVSDSMPGSEVNAGTNTSLSLNFKSTESIEQTFLALSGGANVTMALQDTFWGARFGMLTDRFGINWMFNHDYEKK